MNYGYTKKLSQQFDAGIIKIKEELKKEGFGILTEIDVQKTLKEKLNEDFDKYLILGACNPPFAFEALRAEKHIGLLLPCNIIIYKDGGDVFVSAVNPTVAMGMVENEKLAEIAKKIEEKLKRAIDKV